MLAKIRPTSQEFSPEISRPSRGLSVVGKVLWLTWRTGFAATAVVRRRWPKKAFLRAYRALSGWRHAAAFSTWLFDLATNLYRSELKRIPASTVSLDDVAEPRDLRPVDGGLEDRERDWVVRRAVFRLPAKYRETLILFYFHGMDVPSAARSLGLPEGTFKARLFRAREILRGKLPRLLMAPRWKEGSR